MYSFVKGFYPFNKINKNKYRELNVFATTFEVDVTHSYFRVVFLVCTQNL